MENTFVNNLDRIWSGLDSATRHVLLGHDRDLLTSEDKMRLARVAGSVRRNRRGGRGRR